MHLFLYLDPGSGSLLIQLILAALLGIGVAVRIFWRSIKAGLEAAFSPLFTIHERVRIHGSERTMYWMEKNR